MVQKLGAVPPFVGEGDGFPSIKIWPGPRPAYMPSSILINPTFLPQYTKVTDRQTDRQDRIDNGPIA